MSNYSISDYIHYVIASKIKENSTILDMGGKGRMKTWHSNVTNANIRSGIDGTNLPYEDNYFDVTVSIATLEHVGDNEKQCKFIQEAIRVCRKKSIHWFPINQDFENFMKKLGHDHECIVPNLFPFLSTTEHDSFLTNLITVSEQAFCLSTYNPKLNCEKLLKYINQNQDKYYGILLEINKN